MQYNTHTLACGLRVIHRHDRSPVVYCGFGINAGARDEQPGKEGLAHFCEHVTFKGTARRRSWHILNCLEKVGGDLNAFTNKEDTVYFAAILREHLPRAVDLLSDIVFHSTYPQTEIDKEVEVIADEIESYNDTPAELIFDEFENILFNGHPLGHNILGTADVVRHFTTDDALRWANQYYRPENMVFFAYGDIDFSYLVRLLEKVTVGFPATVPCLPDEVSNIAMPLLDNGHQGIYERQRGTHQAHVMVGNRGYGIHNDQRMALYLLNNLLGGPGMNARFNLSLRERRGLVYTVESSMVNYSDTGDWCVYFGCDHKDVTRCLRLVRHELDKVMTQPLTTQQLLAAKRQLKGQIGVSCDARESFALGFGKSFLHYGWERDIQRLYMSIDEVTASQIQQVAQELFAPDTMTTLIYR